MSIVKQPGQAGSPEMAPPGGTAWRILCLWPHSVMAEIPGEQHS